MANLFRSPSRGRGIISPGLGVPISTGQYSVSRIRTMAGDDAWSRLHVDMSPLQSLIVLSKTKAIYAKRVAQAAKIIHDAAYYFAPYLTGHLREHIEVRSSPVESLPKVVMEVGVDISVVPYAAHQEWGTYRHKAHPYLRPAIDQTRHRVVLLLSKGVSEDLISVVVGKRRRTYTQMDLEFGDWQTTILPGRMLP